MKVLVTGGTGFIGMALVKHLIRSGHNVRLLARNKTNKFLPAGSDVEIVEGDIISSDDVSRAVKGCSVVFNVAGGYYFYPFWEREAKALYDVNVRGTINMLECALEHGVSRFIHTSTIATIGKRPDGKPSDENTEFDFKRADHYARSKYLAEQEVLKYSKKGLSAVILNPAIVFGEGDHRPTPSGEIICKFLNRNYPGYFETIWAVADVNDVAQAHIAAIDHGQVGGRYIICDKRHYSMKEVFSLLEEISGVKAPKIKFPIFLLMTYVYIDEFFSRMIFKKKPLMPVEGVKFCRKSIIYDSAKAAKALGYNATLFKDSLAEAVKWYQNNGYVTSLDLTHNKSLSSNAAS